MTVGRSIRVSGLVQGVGFRPMVWRLARSLSLTGSVKNDAAGVVIEAFGSEHDLEELERRLRSEAPVLARVDAIDTRALSTSPTTTEFRIDPSAGGDPTAGVLPDAALCADCRTDTLSADSRHFGYAFTNCTACGPRFSILRRIPYDRANTSMAGFVQCDECAREYSDPASRRFHAQPNACPACGPRTNRSAVEIAQAISRGEIVAIKGLGGYHLTCDALNDAAVRRLRARKQRYDKPFALMARNASVVERYARVTEQERELLESTAAPIVLLAREGERVADDVARGSSLLGFLLPYTPLHLLLFQELPGPLVMTSGNQSDLPPVTDDADAKTKLSSIADSFWLHDRPIENRVDDSVVRVIAGKARSLRRARGYAPRPLRLPAGFEHTPRILALGGDLKSTFCLLDGARAIVSQHIGDLENAETHADYQKHVQLYRELFRFEPELVVSDLHPDYFSTRLGLEWSKAWNVPLERVQHHHAHIASCLFEHGRALDAEPVLGVALDGLGMGEEGALFGGEFFHATYAHARRLGTFRPVALVGGDRAALEPWRSAYAHLAQSIGIERFLAEHPELPLATLLRKKPLATLASLLENPRLAPPASSVGRLFDAVAATLGLHAESVSFEGQAAMALESLVEADDGRYPFAIEAGVVSPEPMWRALLADLAAGVSRSAIAARFHAGLGAVIVELSVQLARDFTDTLVLGGGVFQNRVLTEHVIRELESAGLSVFSASELPTNDGGLSLGQAAVTAARAIQNPKE